MLREVREAKIRRDKSDRIGEIAPGAEVRLSTIRRVQVL